MSNFVMTPEYRAWQIRSLEAAIKGTRENMARQTTEKAIEAHEAQIRSYERDLAKLKAEAERRNA